MRITYENHRLLQLLDYIRVRIATTDDTRGPAARKPTDSE